MAKCFKSLILYRPVELGEVVAEQHVNLVEVARIEKTLV